MSPHYLQHAKKMLSRYTVILNRPVHIRNSWLNPTLYVLYYVIYIIIIMNNVSK